MAQATVNMKQMESGRKSFKRPNEVDGEPKKRTRTKVAVETQTDVQSIHTQDLYGCYNDMQIMYTKTYVSIEKKKCDFRLYPNHLTTLNENTLALSTAMQDKAAFNLQLSDDVDVTIQQFNEGGMYVALTRALKSGKKWNLSLKIPEFVYLLESLDDLLVVLQASSNNSNACTPISSNELLDIAVQTYASLATDVIKHLKSNKCNGCTIDHPSQLQHDVCMNEDTTNDIETYYLQEAVDAVTFDVFEIMYKVCKSTMRNKVKDAVLLPYRVKEDLDTTMFDKETNDAIDQILQAAAAVNASDNN